MYISTGSNRFDTAFEATIVPIVCGIFDAQIVNSLVRFEVDSAKKKKNIQKRIDMISFIALIEFVTAGRAANEEEKRNTESKE